MNFWQIAFWAFIFGSFVLLLVGWNESRRICWAIALGLAQHEGLT